MKEKYVPVRMTDDMVQELDRQAKKLQIRGRSQVVREALDSFFKSEQPELRREMIDEFEMWRKSFWRVGSNLNQIARHMNLDHPLSSAQIKDVISELQNEFSDLTKKFREIKIEMDLYKGY